MGTLLHYEILHVKKILVLLCTLTSPGFAALLHEQAIIKMPEQSRHRTDTGSIGTNPDPFWQVSCWQGSWGISFMLHFVDLLGCGGFLMTHAVRPGERLLRCYQGALDKLTPWPMVVFAEFCKYQTDFTRWNIWIAIRSLFGKIYLWWPNYNGSGDGLSWNRPWLGFATLITPSTLN